MDTLKTGLFFRCREVTSISEVVLNIGCILKYTALMLFRPFHMLNVATTSWPELFERGYYAVVRTFVQPVKPCLLLHEGA